MILTIDNFDSFTWNLVQYMMQLGFELKVIRNDAMTVEQIEKMNPTHIVISPGPGNPKNSGISLEVLRRLSGRIPILGVCLGHQAIGEVFGGEVVPAKNIMHGKTSKIFHQGLGVFRGIPNGFTATRYHSLAIERNSVPPCLEVTAKTEDGEIMGIQHKTLPVHGVQFHPESILTEYGLDLLKNFLT
jgi:anthranilate synthase component 2